MNVEENNGMRIGLGDRIYEVRKVKEEERERKNE